MQRELYEKLYFFELDAREKINARLQLPVALVTAAIGGVAFAVRQARWNDVSGVNAIGILFLAACVVFLALSLWHFVESWYDNAYEFMPTALDLEAHRKELELYVRAYSSTLTVDELFDAQLVDVYAKCTSKNALMNERRSVEINLINKWLILCFLSLFFSISVFGVDSLVNPIAKSPYRVEVVNLNEVTSEIADGKRTRPQGSCPKPSTAAAAATAAHASDPHCP